MNKIFLATTSIDYFWDKNATSGVFLGEWCKKNNKKGGKRDFDSTGF